MKALITGISGQDGQLMTKFLLEEGYEIHGLSGRAEAVSALQRDFEGHPVFVKCFDYSKPMLISELIGSLQPDICFNFAAKSTGLSFFNEPRAIFRNNAEFVSDILEAIKNHSPHTRFFQSSSSEMFGKVTNSPQDEQTPLRPMSPYAAAKTYAHNLTQIYRDAFGLNCCAGILYNHESYLRRTDYVTGKIAHAAASIKLGYTDKLELGTTSVSRDWGSAHEYIRAMYMMVTAAEMKDYVISTGKLNTVETFCRICFDYVGLDFNDYIETDPEMIRPVESVNLCGDPSKIEADLGWTAKTGVTAIAHEMVDYHLKALAT
ncbi:MAG: GDP-mannose 4,6-dehydratase [Parasphingorhabdus sp.]|nr:GDP-mannose 4,6-dehydratase [Parasphingorhabdus sp.]